MERFITMLPKLLVAICVFLVFPQYLIGEETVAGIQLQKVHEQIDGNHLLEIFFSKTSHMAEVAISNRSDRNRLFDKIFIVSSSPFRPLIAFFGERYFILNDSKLHLYNCANGVYVEMNSIYDSALFIVGDKAYIEPAFEPIGGIEIDYINYTVGNRYSKKRPFDIKYAVRARDPVSVLWW